MSTPNTRQVKLMLEMYNARAPSYDSSWHVAHAADYINHASLQPGEHVLDLGCGTGLVALPAARAVLAAGTVTAIDISPAMLEVARQSAARDGLENVTWLQHNVAHLEGLGAGQLRAGGYDAVTAASCLPLFEDPEAAVRHWAGYVAAGGSGRLVLDVPAEKAQLPGKVYEEVCALVGRRMGIGRGGLEGKGSLEALVRGAGLVVERSFVARGYGSAQQFDRPGWARAFEKWADGAVVPQTGLEGDARSEAKKLFVQRFDALAGEDGIVREDDGFYVVVGRKE